MNRTKIEYLTHTWNPIAMRCSRVSEGCRRCWHLSMADRLAQNPTMSDDRRQAYGGGVPVLLVDELTAPLRTRKPAVIGVEFMGDLFHDAVASYCIFEVFKVIQKCQHHRFIILTKRPERMKHVAEKGLHRWFSDYPAGTPMFPHVMLGVSIEDQQTADLRLPVLSAMELGTGHKVVSLEPMLEPVNLHLDCNPVDWVIMGCESGPGARPMNIEWARSVKDQCVAAGVPLFYKQGPGDDGITCGMPMLDGQVWAQKPERIQP